MVYQKRLGGSSWHMIINKIVVKHYDQTLFSRFLAVSIYVSGNLLLHILKKYESRGGWAVQSLHFQHALYREEAEKGNVTLRHSLLTV